ncbi:MAG TPA: glycosyltransferase family 4 protein, partial [Clostridia bacterium]|nr:glycosyltransferase family 4 protein [Clostridia bacterium]
MLSWEYPPSSVGGLAKHVEELSEALSKKSVEIHVLTVGKNHAPKVERKNNLWIYRVEPYPLQTPNFLTWIQHL